MIDNKSCPKWVLSSYMCKGNNKSIKYSEQYINRSLSVRPLSLSLSLYKPSPIRNSIYSEMSSLSNSIYIEISIYRNPFMPKFLFTILPPYRNPSLPYSHHTGIPLYRTPTIPESLFTGHHIYRNPSLPDPTLYRNPSLSETIYTGPPLYRNPSLPDISYKEHDMQFHFFLCLNNSPQPKSPLC